MGMGLERKERLGIGPLLEIFYFYWRSTSIVDLGLGGPFWFRWCTVEFGLVGFCFLHVIDFLWTTVLVAEDLEVLFLMAACSGDLGLWKVREINHQFEKNVTIQKLSIRERIFQIRTMNANSTSFKSIIWQILLFEMPTYTNVHSVDIFFFYFRELYLAYINELDEYQLQSCI